MKRSYIDMQSSYPRNDESPPVKTPTFYIAWGTTRAEMGGPAVAGRSSPRGERDDRSMGELSELAFEDWWQPALSGLVAKVWDRACWRNLDRSLVVILMASPCGNGNTWPYVQALMRKRASYQQSFHNEGETWYHPRTLIGKVSHVHTSASWWSNLCTADFVEAQLPFHSV